MNSFHISRKAVGRALLIIIFILAALKAYRAVTATQRLTAQIERLRQPDNRLFDGDDLPGSIANVRGELHTFYTDWNTLQNALWPLDTLAYQFTWVPDYGDDLAVGLQLRDIASASLEAVMQIDAMLGEQLQSSDELMSNTTMMQLVDTIESSPEAVAQIKAYAEEANSSYTALPAQTHQLAPQLAQVIRQLNSYYPLFYLGVTSLDAVPSALGISEPHNVLVLVQNADEIRPTGGFITAAAYITIEDGAIKQMIFSPSNDRTIDRWDNVKLYGIPPQPMRDYMNLHLWLFRDANWSPDFPTTARKAAEIFSASREVPVDTVIGINQFTIRELLQITGAIALDDGTVANSSNFIEVAQESWELGWEVGRGRKDIFEDLGVKFLESIQRQTSLRKGLQTLEIVFDLGAKKNLFLYSSQAPLQGFIESSGLDGAISSARSDYLHLVDTNISYNKAGFHISKQFDYHVSLQDVSAPYSILNVSYQHLGEPIDEVCPTPTNAAGRNYELRGLRCFGDYLRVYVADNPTSLALPYFEIPEEYKWVDVQQPGQFRQALDEHGKGVFAGLIVIPPGERASGQFVYKLDPEKVLEIRPNRVVNYPLLIQKQSGIEPYPITITIDLPADATLLSSTPYPTAIDTGSVYFEQLFAEDLLINLEFQLPEPASQ